jgi:hypothetical protein
MFADELNDLFTRHGFWHGTLTAANLPGFDSEKAEVIKQLVMLEAKQIYRASYASALGSGLSTRQALEKLAAIHRDNGHLVNQAAPAGLKESILEGGRQELIAAMANLLPARPVQHTAERPGEATAEGLP